MDEDQELFQSSFEAPSASSGASSAQTGEEELNSSGASRVIPGPSAKGNILVNPKQRGNPVLKHIRNVPWEYDAEVIPDYVIGATACAMFLSIRYHNLHPDYIHERLKELKNAYDLRVLLVQIDVPDPYPILKTLTHISMLANLTIILAHSAEDAGKILENYKIHEHKPPDSIQERQDPSIVQQVVDALTSIRSVNKTDAMTLLRVFGSLETMLDASPEKIALCPGVGPQKAQRIHSALHEQFKKESNSPSKYTAL